jgi:hypothetical protein
MTSARPASRRRRATLLVGSTLLALLVAEIGLRVAGFGPWRDETIDVREPTMHGPDPVLGWTNRPGAYTVPPYHPEGSEMRYVFLENGARRTHEAQSASGDERAKVIAVGGSFMQGLALSDGETIPWAVQERLPEMEVLNFGCGGYGTYQSLLALERVLPGTPRPAFVVYGFIEHHETRNVAPPNWVAHLARFTRRGHVAVPFVTSGPDGALARHAPVGHRRWPMGERLAVVATAQRAWARVTSAPRMRSRRAVTEGLLLEMRDVTHRHGAVLVVVLLACDEETRAHYEAFLGGAGIAVADCSVTSIPASRRVRGEGHPGPEQAASWAACVADAIAAGSG